MSGLASDERFKTALESLVEAFGHYGHTIIIVPWQADELPVIRSNYILPDITDPLKAFDAAKAINDLTRSPFGLGYEEAYEVAHAWRRLNAEIVSYERATGRSYTIVMVMGCFYNPIKTSVDGVEAVTLGIDAVELLETALSQRRV